MPLQTNSAPNEGPFSTDRKPARDRRHTAVAMVQKHGTINRSDIVQVFNVSVLTASHDLQAIMRELPGLMEYDTKRKAYVLTQK